LPRRTLKRCGGGQSFELSVELLMRVCYRNNLCTDAEIHLHDSDYIETE